MESYEFIKMLIEGKVLSVESMGDILDTPKLREHLKERRAAIAGLVPKLHKWVKTEERRSRIERQNQAATRFATSRRQLPLRPRHEKVGRTRAL